MARSATATPRTPDRRTHRCKFNTARGPLDPLTTAVLDQPPSRAAKRLAPPGRLKRDLKKAHLGGARRDRCGFLSEECGFKPKDLNANCVKLRLQESDGGVRPINIKHCGAPEDCASWLEAARVVKRQLSLHLGTPVVVAAEERVRLGLGAAPVLPEPQLAELTEEDMEWLATWFDGLPDPPRSGRTCHERAPAWLTQVRTRYSTGLPGFGEESTGFTRLETTFWPFCGRGFKGALSLVATNIKSPNQHSLGHPGVGRGIGYENWAPRSRSGRVGSGLKRDVQEIQCRFRENNPPSDPESPNVTSEVNRPRTDPDPEATRPDPLAED